ncbi:MAG TPA: hypothetical protein VFA26_15365 [Gemmataceae bacterium]|nr:hypothetical protein [Gemmataceae bacterium]
MVEQNRNPEPGNPPSARHPNGGRGQPGWMARVLGIGVSLMAVIRALGTGPDGGPPAQQPAAQPEEGDGHHPPGEPFHPSVRYERADVKFRWVVGILVVSLVLAVIIHYVVWRFFVGYRDYQAEVKASTYPLAAAQSDTLPAEPRLEQINRLAGVERPNVYVREEAKEKILHSYGKAEGAGYVHIPIDRAMDLLARQELGPKAQPSEGQAKRENGLIYGGEPNSGRKFRGKGP